MSKVPGAVIAAFVPLRIALGAAAVTSPDMHLHGRTAAESDMHPPG